MNTISNNIAQCEIEAELKIRNEQKKQHVCHHSKAS
ncbi:hypothetical protein T4B_1667 [Trichinella pseudospiralis]|uniref:Uncharacterized protein n=1 Tax=Trichinella pseudospiralis TaxID=6337 RepID=A0A0V1G8P5_TRIPS|nr:hypothetical protein T4B_1667 [Trichinella pseudospiralis]KRY95627.1 hypothetical protein T4C_10029 [Trichinella pseudospiralis]